MAQLPLQDWNSDIQSSDVSNDQNAAGWQFHSSMAVSKAFWLSADWRLFPELPVHMSCQRDVGNIMPRGVIAQDSISLWPGVSLTLVLPTFSCCCFAQSSQIVLSGTMPPTGT